MVACTFLSAPLMFVSAKMISLANIDPSEYVKQLNNYSFDLSIASLVTAIWVLLVFVLTKKITKIPHRFTALLLVSQVPHIYILFNPSLYCLFRSLLALVL